MNTETCVKTGWLLNGWNRHVHTSWEIVLQLTGENTTVIEGCSYRMEPGDILVIPPGYQHELHSDDVYTDMYIQAEKLDFHDVVKAHDIDKNVLIKQRRGRRWRSE